MTRVLLLANPSASGFTGGLHREVVAALSATHEVEAAWPRDPEESRSMAAKAAAEGVELVVAMGGDGVVHHVANGVAGTDSTLGIIPAGTTNVVARLLGVPARPDHAAASLAAGGPAVQVPLTELTCELTDSTALHRFSTFAAGAGFDADVVNVAEQEPFRKYRFGGYHYARTATEVVLKDYRSRPPNLVATIDGVDHPAVAVLIQLHRRYTYFGRLPLGVAAHEPDTLSVMIIDRLALPAVPGILLAASTKRDLNKVKGVTACTGVRSLSITAPDGAPAQADGEALGSISRLDAQIRPGLLRVAVPPDADGERVAPWRRLRRR